MKKIIMILIIIFVFLSNLMAGWLIEMKENNRIQKIYFDDNKLSVTMDNTKMIFESSTEKIYFLNIKQKTYWSGTIDEFSKTIEETFSQARNQMASQLKMQEAQLSKLPPQQQEMLKKMMGNMSKPNTQPEKIKIKKLGAEKIKNISCQKIEVYSNNQLKEKLWLSQDLPFYKDFQNAKFQQKMVKIQNTFSQISGELDYKANAKYTDLLTANFIIKSEIKMPDMMGISGQTATSEYISSKKMDVSKYLNLPKEYKQQPLPTILQQNMKIEKSQR